MEQDTPEVPETPKKDKELKGHKKQSEVYNVLCPACGRYVKDNETRRFHIRAYHVKLLKACHFCMRSYLHPWDYDTHMNRAHVWCDICKGHTKNQEKYESHCRQKHAPTSSLMKVTMREPTPEKEPDKEPTKDPAAGSEQITDLSQSVISDGVATTETDREDRPFKCKHCERTFKKAPQLNMHVNTKHKIHKCTDCGKHFITEEGRDNHKADVHKYPRFHCRKGNCNEYAHNTEELYCHKRAKHWSKFPYRCNMCPGVFVKRDLLDKHLERNHHIPALKDDGSKTYKCTKCARTFRSLVMFINHSGDHPKNKHKCKECNWCFATLGRLHVHCEHTHDTMHNACDTCGTDYPNNDALYHHIRDDHVKICHICRDYLVSDSQLQEHLDETHAQTPVKSREQMIDEERAKEHEEKERRKHDKKKKKKKKKKRQDDDDDEDDEEEDDSMYYLSRDHGDSSGVDPEWVPSQRALRRADKEGDQ